MPNIVVAPAMVTGGQLYAMAFVILQKRPPACVILQHPLDRPPHDAAYRKVATAWSGFGMMEAKYVRDVAQAAACLKRGGIVAFPTETFYGLAALPTCADALSRMAALKGRDGQKPMALIAADLAAAQRLLRFGCDARALARAFWPGPLTLLLPARRRLSPLLTGPDPARLVVRGCVGVRVSAHPVARTLCRGAGQCLTATSANLAGGEPVTRARRLHAAIVAGVDLILEAEHKAEAEAGVGEGEGEVAGGLASTVVRLGRRGLYVVRHGAIDVVALRHRLVLARAWRARAMHAR